MEKSETFPKIVERNAGFSSRILVQGRRFAVKRENPADFGEKVYWKAREYGFHTSMIEASMTVNDGMPEWCASRAARLLNAKSKAMKDAKILVLGVAYKQDTCTSYG